MEMPPSNGLSVVVTGASGFIGRQLVPRLAAAGCKLLLVGRDAQALAALFPAMDVCTYDESPQRAKNYDILVHLAVLNNTVEARAEDFERVNVQLLSSVLAFAKAAGIKRFVNLTTFHAIDGKGSAYAQSKRKALDIIKNQKAVAVTNIFLPAVYGDDFAGRLSILKKLPTVLRKPALVFLAALVPTVHIDRLAGFITSDLSASEKDVMLANPQEENIVYRTGKALADGLFAVTVIGLFWWLLLIAWGLIRLDSKGPGIFAQQRIGKDGKPFTCYKFRTMQRGTKQAGTHEVTADAVTRIGNFLRKTKLDELPQIGNILRGELSLVGPRPCLPVQVDLIQEREKRGVFSVAPGITGLAQINNIDMSDPVRLARMDARYIAQRSLILDLKIILATFLGRGQGDKIGV